MKTLNLTPTELAYIVNNYEFVGRGPHGIVVKLNDDYLLKFKYKDFVDTFDTDDKLGDISNIIKIRKSANLATYNSTESNRVKMIKHAIEKQQFVNHSTLTQGLVYVDDFCVGYVLKYHKNMVSLHKFLHNANLSDFDKNVIFYKVKTSVDELMKNYIYLSDLSTNNILINPKTKQLEIINFEDSLTCYDEENLFDKQTMTSKLEKIKSDFEIKNDDELLMCK